MADASLDTAAVRALLDEYDRAAAEVARLSLSDDLGSGERTARLSSLSAWEIQRERIADRIAALTGDAVRGASDIDRLRALVDSAGTAARG